MVRALTAPTRDQLAKFLPDQEAIRKLERLFFLAGELTPTQIVDILAALETILVGVSGGVVYHDTDTSVASSGELQVNRLVLGGGAGGAPSTPVGLGSTVTVLHGNAAGAPSFGAVALTDDVSGTLPPVNGGTGIFSYAVGDLLYASGPTALSRLADVATGSVLKAGGLLTAPFYGKVDLTADVTGVLPLANGGSAKALTASNGGMVYTDADSMEVLPGTATAGQVLRSGANAAPSWSAATYPATATAGRVLLATGSNVWGDGPAPVANGTYTIDAVTPGALTSITTTNGLITAVTTL